MPVVPSIATSRARARSEVTGMKQEALEVMASRSALKRKLKA